MSFDFDRALKRKDAEHAAAIAEIRTVHDYVQLRLLRGETDFEGAVRHVVDRLARFLADAAPPYPGDGPTR
jgi:hypothetical protein